MPMRQLKNLDELSEGSIVRNKFSADAYIVVGIYGDFAVVVRQLLLTNPKEWLVYYEGESEGR